MSSDGHTAVLRSLLLETKDGEWGKDSPFDDSLEMVVIRGTDFERAGYSSTAEMPVRHIARRNGERKTLRPGDILIETAGGTKGKPTGKTVFLRPQLFARSDLPLTCASFARFMRVNPELAHAEYVYWYLQHLYKNGAMENHQVQHTGIARFQFTKFAESTELILPPRDTQIELANFFGAIDDRIALLLETNTTLEAIAQALFKSWFIDFEPVQARVRGAHVEGLPDHIASLFPDSFDESSLGSVPRGWRVGKIDDLMEFAYGKALKSTDRVDGHVPVYGSGGVAGYHNESLVDGPSIIVGRKGTVGSLFWEDRAFFPIDTVFYVRTSEPLTYCYYLLRTLGLEGMNTDAAVPGLNRNNAYRLKVTIPSVEVRNAFHEIVSSLRDRIFANNGQVQTLTKLRDTLLPRLISGRLRLTEIAA